MSSPAATTPSPSVHPRTGPRTRPCSNCGAAIGFAAKSCKQCKTKTRRGLGLAPLEAASTAARRAGADRREAARIEDRLSSLVGKNLYRVSRVSAGALEASSPEHARFDAAVIKGLDQAAARGAVKVRSRARSPSPKRSPLELAVRLWDFKVQQPPQVCRPSSRRGRVRWNASFASNRAACGLLQGDRRRPWLRRAAPERAFPERATGLRPVAQPLPARDCLRLELSLLCFAVSAGRRLPEASGRCREQCS